jgi:hypothetical protein
MSTAAFDRGEAEELLASAMPTLGLKTEEVRGLFVCVGLKMSVRVAADFLGSVSKSQISRRLPRAKGKLMAAGAEGLWGESGDTAR